MTLLQAADVVDEVLELHDFRILASYTDKFVTKISTLLASGYFSLLDNQELSEQQKYNRGVLLSAILKLANKLYFLNGIVN